MKPPWQQQQEQMRRQQEQMRRQQEQMRRQQEQRRQQQMGAAWSEQQRRQQEQMRRQQMGADWLKKQRPSGLEEEPGLQPSYAVDEGPSCIGRLARTFFYLLVIVVVLFLAYACLSTALGSSF
jgi:hypothetical protein